MLAVAAAPLARAQETGELKTLAVVTLSGYDELMEDVNFVGSLGGQPQAAEGIKGLINMATQQKGLVGLDKSKPIGLIMQSDGESSIVGAACLPVTDLKALLEALNGFGVTGEDMGDGMFQVSLPNGMVGFAENKDGWAKISLSPEMIQSLPADPGAVLAPLADEYDLSVQVNVQSIPAAYREMAVDQMSQGANDSLAQKADESDEDFAARQAQVDAQVAEMKRFFTELDQFTMGLSINREDKRAYFDVAYTAVPGTKLAEDLAASNNATTNFAGFIQPDAAMTLSFASKVAGADKVQLEQMVETLRTKAAEAVEEESELKSDASRDAMKAALNDFIDVLKATLEAGVIDGGAVMHLSPDAMTLVAGGFVGDPAKVEEGLKKLEQVSKEESLDMPEVKWNAQTLGDVKFHVMSKPTPADDEAKQALLGETAEIAVGIGPNAVYFAMGKNWLEGVKKVIDDSAASPNKAVPPMEMKVALTQIFQTAKEFADEDEKAQLESMAEMLANDAAGRDHVTIVASPLENGVKMRIEAEEGVLRAIGMAAMNSQMQGAGF